MAEILQIRRKTLSNQSMKTMTKGPIHCSRSFFDWPILEEVSTMYTTSPTTVSDQAELPVDNPSQIDDKPKIYPPALSHILQVLAPVCSYLTKCLHV